MSDQNISNPPPPPPPAHGSGSGDGGTANIIYILYLVGIAVGITTLVGVIMAYIYKAEAPEWLQSHHRFQIRTFWIGMLYGVIGSVLTAVWIGYFVLLFLLVWWIVRCIKGMRAIAERKAVQNLESWLI